MTAFVALLRGVNVGGANKLPMERLREIFAAAGAERAETLIQSGNVVFEAPRERADAIAEQVRAAIAGEFGFAAPLVLRDATRWGAILAANPFLAAGAEPDTLHLCCLSAPPAPDTLARLDPNRSPPDAFVVAGADIYLRLPNGVAPSRLTNAWLDKTLGVVSTTRNWRTVERIAAALRARAEREATSRASPVSRSSPSPPRR